MKFFFSLELFLGEGAGDGGGERHEFLSESQTRAGGVDADAGAETLEGVGTCVGELLVLLCKLVELGEGTF